MRKENYGWLYLLNTIILFSTYEVVSKTLVGKINPFQINLIRFFIGGLILFFFLLLKDSLKITFRDFLWVGLIGIINVVISMNLVQISLFESNAKASVIAVIFSSNPIFVTLFAAIIEKEKITLIKLLGLLIGICGIITVFFEKLNLDSLDIKSPLLALGAAVFFGLYTVLGKRVSLRIGSLKMNSYSFILGSIVLFPILICFKMPVASFDYTGIFQVIYLSILVTGIAYLTYFKGLSIVGASKGSLVFFVKPILASMIAIFFLKEHVTVYLFLGTILILSGVYIAIFGFDMKKL